MWIGLSIFNELDGLGCGETVLPNGLLWIRERAERIHIFMNINCIFPLTTWRLLVVQWDPWPYFGLNWPQSFTLPSLSLVPSALVINLGWGDQTSVLGQWTFYSDDVSHRWVWKRKFISICYLSMNTFSNKPIKNVGCPFKVKIRKLVHMYNCLSYKYLL